VSAELGAERAASRLAVTNTVLRASGEIVGKLASLALFALLARELGQTGLGEFVFALAFLQIAMVPVEFGLDRYLLRRLAKDPGAAHGLVHDVISVKLALGLPVLGLGVGVLVTTGAEPDVVATVAVLSVAFLLDAVVTTLTTVFLAFERGGLVALVVVVQRVAVAALGITALVLGYELVTVAAAYAAGSAVGLMATILVLARRVGLPRREVRPARWRGLVAVSLPFAAQDVFSVLLFKADAVLLSLVATEAAVGRYGAAYRLLESSLFITYALTGAFSPMYTYLEDCAVPRAFARSIKLALVGLVPIAATFGMLAEPILTLMFGEGLAGATDSLRLLAPVVVLLGVVTLASSLVVSRGDPRAMVRATAAAAALNIGLNLALGAAYEDIGAAAAMLVTEGTLLVIVLRILSGRIGPVPWVPALTGPLTAGTAMLVVMLLLNGVPLLALVVGATTYLTVLVPVERRVAPDDAAAALRVWRRILSRG